MRAIVPKIVDAWPPNVSLSPRTGGAMRSEAPPCVLIGGRVPRQPGIVGYAAELRHSLRRAYRMAMPLPAAIRAQGPYYTVDILDQLPDDGNRYEVVYGELLVTPAPRWNHQEIVGRLFLTLHRYLERFPEGHLVMSPADVRWGRDTGVQPDLFIVPKAVARTMDWRQIRELLLVIEVLSPSTARADRFTKRRRYQEAGVPVYWIVDPKAEAIEVWTPAATAPVIVKGQVEWAPAWAQEPLILQVGELFTPVE